MEYLQFSDSSARMGPCEAWVWWESHHAGSVELMAAAAGVDVRTILRWRKAGRVPESVAVLMDQIRYGLAVRLATDRGYGFARSEWRDVIDPILGTMERKVQARGPGWLLRLQRERYRRERGLPKF